MGWSGAVGALRSARRARVREGDPAQRCAAAKLKATARKLNTKLTCHQKALSLGRTPSGTCLAKATSAFTLGFAKAEAKGGCFTTGDVAAVEAEVDETVAAFVGDFPTVSTTSTTSTTTTSTTTTTIPLPACATEGLSCGSCSNGICVRHCPGTTLGCVNQAPDMGVIIACSDDTPCSTGRACVANGALCGTGSQNGCFAPCP